MISWEKLPHRKLSDGSVFFLREIPKSMPGWYGTRNIFKRIVPPCIHRGSLQIKQKCCHNGIVPSCDGKQINLSKCYDCTRSKV